MPILGTVASQISGHLTPPDTGAMFPLGMVQVGSAGAANITFSSIPSTYKHLQIRGIWQLSDVGNLKIQFNSDTGANYKCHFLYGDGSSVQSSVTSVSPNAMSLGYKGGTSNFAASICDILDYANTSKYKTIRSLDGNDRNGAGDIEFDSGLWLNTAAVTSITLTPQSGTINQYSSLALYGIKGA